MRIALATLDSATLADIEEGQTDRLDQHARTTEVKEIVEALSLATSSIAAASESETLTINGGTELGCYDVYTYHIVCDSMSFTYTTGKWSECLYGYTNGAFAEIDIPNLVAHKELQPVG